MRWSGTDAVTVCQMTLIINGPFYRYTFQKKKWESDQNSSHGEQQQSITGAKYCGNQSDPWGRNYYRLFPFFNLLLFDMRGNLGETALTAGREKKRKLGPLTRLRARLLSEEADWIHKMTPTANSLCSTECEGILKAWVDVSLRKSHHLSNQADPWHKTTIHKHANSFKWSHDIQDSEELPTCRALSSLEGWNPQQRQNKMTPLGFMCCQTAV